MMPLCTCQCYTTLMCTTRLTSGPTAKILEVSGETDFQVTANVKD